MARSYSDTELLAVLLSREVRDGETSACGALSMIPAAALLLARVHHAPSAEVIILGSPAFFPFPTSRQFHYLAQRGDLDLFFVSGVQIDQQANYNLHQIGGERDRPWHSHERGLRERIRNGAHEPSARAGRRRGLPDHQHSVPIREGQPPEGGRPAGRRCHRHGASPRGRSGIQQIWVAGPCTLIGTLTGNGPGRGGIIDIINVIDRLETLITTSKTVPVSGNIILDKKKAMELVDQMRLSIPQEVKAAEEVLAEKDQIVNQAMLEARRTKTNAEQEYHQRMDQNDLVLSAEARAQETLRDAEQRATRMLAQSEAESSSRRSDADAYALRSLRTLEQEITAIAGSIRKGIDLLAGQTTSRLVAQEAED